VWICSVGIDGPDDADVLVLTRSGSPGCGTRRRRRRGDRLAGALGPRVDVVGRGEPMHLTLVAQRGARPGRAAHEAIVGGPTDPRPSRRSPWRGTCSDAGRGVWSPDGCSATRILGPSRQSGAARAGRLLPPEAGQRRGDRTRPGTVPSVLAKFAVAARRRRGRGLPAFSCICGGTIGPPAEHAPCGQSRDVDAPQGGRGGPNRRRQPRERGGPVVAGFVWIVRGSTDRRQRAASPTRPTQIGIDYERGEVGREPRRARGKQW
jgi:hypothetical protein